MFTSITPPSFWLNRSAAGAQGRPDDLLLLLGQVSCEAPAAGREHPHAPIRDFDVGEYFCGRELVLLSVSKAAVRVTICSHVDF